MTVSIKYTEPRSIPASWAKIVDSNSDTMSYDNPENHWWIHQNMETLAEELWQTVHNKSIQAHKLNHQDTQYNKLFKKLYFVEKKSELMKEMIDVFGDRVRTKTNKDNTTLYVVDERFMVNDSGVSHYKDDSGHYKFLCTVAQGNLSKMTIQTKIGEIELGATELTIMGKIGFLLAPDINDGVFFNQLTDKMQDVLRDEVLFDSENKTALGI